jgi:excisionase family DNA binding protein
MGPDGEVITLPDELYVVLRHAADALLDGFAVTIAPQHRMMTTQEAADLLGISRPTVVRLMENGEIPYLRRGRHRRVMLADLLDYRERTRHNRREALERMVADGEEAGVYDLPATSHPTR